VRCNSPRGGTNSLSRNGSLKPASLLTALLTAAPPRGVCTAVHARGLRPVASCRAFLTAVPAPRFPTAAHARGGRSSAPGHAEERLDSLLVARLRRTWGRGCIFVCWRGFAGGCSSPGDSSLRDADERKRKTPLPSARTANAGPTAGLVRWLSRHMGALGSSRDMGSTHMPFPSGSKPGPSSAPLRSTTPSPLVSTWILSACMTACALVLCGATLPMNKAGLCEVLCVGVVCTR